MSYHADTINFDKTKILIEKNGYEEEFINNKKIYKSLMKYILLNNKVINIKIPSHFFSHMDFRYDNLYLYFNNSLNSKKFINKLNYLDNIIFSTNKSLKYIPLIKNDIDGYYLCVKKASKIPCNTVNNDVSNATKLGDINIQEYDIIDFTIKLKNIWYLENMFGITTRMVEINTKHY